MVDNRITKYGGIAIGKEDAESDDLNNSFSDVVNNSDIADCELAYRILQSNNIFTNGPNLIVDECTDSDGVNNTIDDGTGINNGQIETDQATSDTLHDPNSVTSPSNCFDGDDDTYATASSVASSTYAYLGRTFATKTIKWIRWKAGGSTGPTIVNVQSYDGSTWSNIITADGSGVQYLDTDGVDIQGLRIVVYNNDGSGQDLRFYVLEYGDNVENMTSAEYDAANDYYKLRNTGGVYDDSNKVQVDTGVAIDGNELGFAISVPDATFPAGTGMNVVISDGSFTLNPIPIDTTSKGVVIGNSIANGGPLGSGTLNIEFELTTSNTANTPTLPGYGGKIIR